MLTEEYMKKKPGEKELIGVTILGQLKGKELVYLYLTIL